MSILMELRVRIRLMFETEAELFILEYSKTSVEYNQLVGKLTSVTHVKCCYMLLE